MLNEAAPLIGTAHFTAAISGSAGLGMANAARLTFVQEVFATGEVVKTLSPETSAVVELGGEDAKVIFFDGGTDERMNGSCAGGTGAFIDQMASLLGVEPLEMNTLAETHEKIYSIASRCGVFAKSDIQPLINEGATREDLAASIFQAVVNQTISGLACGKPIRGHVAFLGGPLHFLSELKQAFIRTLNLDEEHAITPEYSHLFAAAGSAMNSTCETVFSVTDTGFATKILQKFGEE